jgi:hypothetical protein
MVLSAEERGRSHVCLVVHPSPRALSQRGVVLGRHGSIDRESVPCIVGSTGGLVKVGRHARVAELRVLQNFYTLVSVLGQRGGLVKGGKVCMCCRIFTC